MPEPRFYIAVVDPGDPLAIRDARLLFEEYYAWLGEVVCSTRLAEEIDSLPRPYVEPVGRLLLARDEVGRPVGCVGIRPHEGDACEIKRLYVREEARDRGLGRQLARYALDACRELGYSEVRMTTLPGTMAGALRMYRSLGFEECEPFFDYSHVHDGVAMVFLKRGI
jgi:ribosomal protein S18 acetylase RimI-like enzyme